MQRNKVLVLLGEIAAAFFVAATLRRGDVTAERQTGPDMQVMPLPYEQATFEYLGRELTRYHFGGQLRRPFWYPIVGPADRSLTRMNMPGDPGRSLTQAVQPQDPNTPKTRSDTAIRRPCGSRTRTSTASTSGATAGRSQGRSFTRRLARVCDTRTARMLPPCSRSTTGTIPRAGP